MNFHSTLGRIKSQNPAVRISAFDFKDHIWLFNLEVQADFQNRGLGSEVMRQLQSLKKTIALIPLPDKGKATALERFYHRLGFVWVGNKQQMIWRPN
jgi:GNAT superfamily N-acetyltransferase